MIVRPYIPDFTTKRLFIVPKQGTKNAATYHGVVEARVDMKRNDSGATGRMVQFGRSENRKLREWHSFWQQLNGSGDDMNIIQVGRAAVSRYHQQRRWPGHIDIWSVKDQIMRSMTGHHLN